MKGRLVKPVSCTATPTTRNDFRGGVQGGVKPSQVVAAGGELLDEGVVQVGDEDLVLLGDVGAEVRYRRRRPGGHPPQRVRGGGRYPGPLGARWGFSWTGPFPRRVDPRAP